MKRIFSMLVFLSLMLIILMNNIELGSPTFENSLKSGARGTLIVGPGQAYTKIQDAINDANPGDIIKIYAGTYNESILVNKTVSLLGNNSVNTIINSTGNINAIKVIADFCNISGLNINNAGNTGLLITSNDNKVENCNITANSRGITIESSEFNLIRNCKCNKNIDGIYLFKAENNIIINTTSNLNTGYGIYFDESPYNDINNCTIELNYCGIYLYLSDNAIINNSISNYNDWYGILLQKSDDIFILNSKCNSNQKDGIYQKVVSDDTYYKFLLNNCTCSWNSNGVIFDKGYGEITNSIFNNNNNFGLLLSSDQTTISFNNLKENGNFGISLGPQNRNSKIYLNNFINNNNDDIQAQDNGWDNKWNMEGMGNYWSEWTTPDSNADGIVDLPYEIDSMDSKDYYPLTDPYGILKLYVPMNKTAFEDELYYEKCYARNTPSKISWLYATNASWLNFSDDHILNGIPLNSDVGTYWINISVSDGTFKDSKNFTLEVINVNDPPEVNHSIGNLSFPEDTIDYSIQLDDWFRDVDSDLIFSTKEAEYLNITIFKNNTVEIVPKKDWFGTENIVFYANDSMLGCSDYVNVTVSPVNDPPGKPGLIINITDAYEKTESEIENLTVNYTILAPEDPDGDTVFKYTLDLGDESTPLVIDFTDALSHFIEHTYASGGWYNVTLTVEDKGGLTNQTIKSYIEVIEPPGLVIIDGWGWRPDDKRDKVDDRIEIAWTRCTLESEYEEDIPEKGKYTITTIYTFEGTCSENVVLVSIFSGLSINGSDFYYYPSYDMSDEDPMSWERIEITPSAGIWSYSWTYTYIGDITESDNGDDSLDLSTYDFWYAAVGWDDDGNFNFAEITFPADYDDDDDDDDDNDEDKEEFPIGLALCIGIPILTLVVFLIVISIIIYIFRIRKKKPEEETVDEEEIDIEDLDDVDEIEIEKE